MMPQAVSQSRPCSSIIRRMISATAIVGCVSFIWNTAFSGSSCQLSPCFALNLARASCRAPDQIRCAHALAFLSK